MTDRRDGEDETRTLERLGMVVKQRTNAAVWRAFLVAQTTVQETHRRREMTTQRLLLIRER